MKFFVDKQEHYTLISLEEDKLDSAVSPALKSELVTLNAEGTRNLVLDMSHVKYTDSSGLSAILVANRLCKDAGGTLAIAGISEHTLKLIRISQLENVLNLLPTRKEAVEAVMLNTLEADLRKEENGRA